MLPDLEKDRFFLQMLPVYSIVLASKVREKVMGKSELITQLDDNSFEQVTSQGLVLVDFFAEWCGPCRMLSPILEELAEKFEGKMRVAQLDIDVAQQATTKFEVMSVPTLILFKNGQEVERVVGLRDADALTELVSKSI